MNRTAFAYTSIVFGFLMLAAAPILAIGFSACAPLLADAEKAQAATADARARLESLCGVASTELPNHPDVKIICADAAAIDRMVNSALPAPSASASAP